MTCTAVERLLDVYVVGALVAYEVRAVELHLARCPRCQALLRISRRMADLLRLAVPQVDPPPGLHARLMAEVHRDLLARARPPAWSEDSTD